MMNPYYDPQILKKAIFPKWNWLFLWLWPTYVAFDGVGAIFYKQVRKRIYIVGEEKLP